MKWLRRTQNLTVKFDVKTFWSPSISMKIGCIQSVLPRKRSKFLTQYNQIYPPTCHNILVMFTTSRDFGTFESILILSDCTFVKSSTTLMKARTSLVPTPNWDVRVIFMLVWTSIQRNRHEIKLVPFPPYTSPSVYTREKEMVTNILLAWMI